MRFHERRKRKCLYCIVRNDENWEGKEYESVVTEHDNKQRGEKEAQNVN